MTRKLTDKHIKRQNPMALSSGVELSWSTVHQRNGTSGFFSKGSKVLVAFYFQLFANNRMEVTTVILAVTCTILCGIVSFVVRYTGRRRLYELASKFEGPPALPLIGSAHLFIGSGEDHLKRIKKIVHSYPAPFRFWLAYRLIIGVTDPEQIKTVLMSPKTLERGYMYEFIKSFTGTSLFTAPAPQWRAQRKLIQPTFNAKIMNSYVKVFDSQSKILVSKMEQHLDGPEFEIFDLLALASLDILCETLMDVKIGAQTNAKSPYVDAVQKIGTTISQRLFSIWLHPDFIFNHSQLVKDQRRAFKIIHDFTEQVIQQKKLQLHGSGDLLEPPDQEDDEFQPRTRARTFLDSLLKVSRGTIIYNSDEEFRDEVAAMLIAGHDTTALMMYFVTLMLASHPEVQEKVYRELFEIFGDDVDREVTNEDLGRMNYLELTLKETMRLFPVAPAVTRAVTDDLDIGGHTLPKGSEVLIPILEIHRSEKYWPDPMKFDPDRFLPEEVAKRHPYSYLAFGGGPRNCVGQRHAMMGMKILVATILRKYILKKDIIVPVKDIRLKIEILIKPVHPITIKIERRARI